MKDMTFDYIDPLFEEAALIIYANQIGSTSLIQRKMKLGYSRASYMMDQLEAAGIVGPVVGSGAREVYIKDIGTLETVINDFKARCQSSSNDSIFSKRYYELLLTSSHQLAIIVKKLSEDNILIESLKSEVTNQHVSEFISNCIFYDLSQIIKLLHKKNICSDNIVLSTIIFIYNFNFAENNILKDFDFPQTRNFLLQTSTKNFGYDLLNLANCKNPLEIGVGVKKDLPSKKFKSDLSLLAALKMINHLIFNEYAAVLYHLAEIIIRDDNNAISSEEERLLKEIYQITHNPIPEEANESLIVSNSNENIENIMKELDELIGLDSVKKEIKTLINFIKIQKAREVAGLKFSNISYHIVFMGNPGTGKTTVARIVAKIYKALGILSQGQLIETDRSGLIAEYVGQTAIKVNKIVDSAINGVLFIDEAYSITDKMQNDYGKEAVATLVKRMEDNRDKLVVILAGYTNEMNEFIETNPGFKSRFNRYIEFPDYSPVELLSIYKSQCSKLEYSLTDDAQKKLNLIFEEAYKLRDKSFGNGRFVRNIFEKTLEKQANRITGIHSLTKEILVTIKEVDIPEIEIVCK